MSFHLYRCRQSSSVTTGTVSVATAGNSSRTRELNSALSLSASRAVPHALERAEHSTTTWLNSLAEMPWASNATVLDAGSNAHTAPVGPTIFVMASVYT